jgi:hypothetical protein
MDAKMLDIEARLTRLEAQVEMLARMVMQGTQSPTPSVGQVNVVGKDEAIQGE